MLAEAHSVFHLLYQHIFVIGGVITAITVLLALLSASNSGVLMSSRRSVGDMLESLPPWHRKAIGAKNLSDLEKAVHEFIKKEKRED